MIEELRKIKSKRTLDGQLVDFIHSSDMFIFDEHYFRLTTSIFSCSINMETNIIYFLIEEYIIEKFKLDISDVRKKIRYIFKQELNLELNQLLVGYK